MKKFITELNKIDCSKRIEELQKKMNNKPRCLSIEQAEIITQAYKNNECKPTIIKRAKAFYDALCNIEIEIDPIEKIVGNRAVGSKTGVVFPEGGVSWVYNEIDIIPKRPQDKFNVDSKDKDTFINSIYPYWAGHTLEDEIQKDFGSEIDEIASVIKINQKDHAQGHVCPNLFHWLKFGPAGLKKKVEKKLENAKEENRDFYESVIITLDGACKFIERYSILAKNMAKNESIKSNRENLHDISKICDNLSKSPPKTYYEAVQSIWFLFVFLETESNSSSFSPGRLDQILYPYYKNDIENNLIDTELALEIMEAIWIKFNEIVYMRNTKGAEYFAGFPIGFNIIIGGQNSDGEDVTNELSYIILRTQEHLKLPQPNFSVRLHKNTPDDFIRRCAEVLKLGTGMPQLFNDESIIPALEKLGISHEEIMDYAVIGCVELTIPGNSLGWSDAAMVNLVKMLELTLNNGICMQTGKKIGIDTGNLTSYKTFEDVEIAFEKQIEYFIGKMVKACEVVEEKHIKLMPSPFLSSVIDNCIDKGVDVTDGGAKYNFSGIQIIQAANIADCFAALKSLVFERKIVHKDYLLKNLKENYPDEELRLLMLNKAPKYGNDIEWVDNIANKWVSVFANKLKKYKNYRGGEYNTGMYTVSAHVPMGKNVGATPDGRRNGEPLADGGLSAVYGRDKNGPTALLKSVNRVNSEFGTNGTLLNMKFSASMFKDKEGFNKFCLLIKSFIKMKIHHVQFNVLNKNDLIAAKKDPEKYSNLLVRVAGYSAYFVDLSDELQNEIIARTEFGT